MGNSFYKLILFLLTPAVAGLLFYFINRYFTRLLKPRDKPINLIIYFIVMLIVGFGLIVATITVLLKLYLFLREID